MDKFTAQAAMNWLEKNNKDKRASYRIEGDTLIVSGDVNITRLKLEKLPDLSSVIITGSFFCSNNILKNLEGSPREVGVCYDCTSNRLESLAGATPIIGESFYCNDNRRLVSLEGMPTAKRYYLSASLNSALREFYFANRDKIKPSVLLPETTKYYAQVPADWAKRVNTDDLAFPPLGGGRQ